MILVTLGTQDKEFSRILKEIDRLIEKKVINDSVIVQAGFTKYKSKNMEIFDYISNKELERFMKQADLLITHGGVGSITLGLKYKKKIIAIARRQELKEHTNNHQTQILNAFYNAGYILKLDSEKDLEDSLKKLKSFKPRKYVSNANLIMNTVDDFIVTNNLLKKVK